MKGRTLAAAATLLTVGASSGLLCSLAITGMIGLPALAGEGGKTSFIDKDFEIALKKHFEKKFFDRINAADDQRDKISALLTARMEESRPLREEMRSDALELTKLVAADTSDSNITEKAHNLRDKRDKLMEQRLQTLLKVRAVLTPDQRKQICDRISNVISGNVSPRAFLRGEPG